MNDQLFANGNCLCGAVSVAITGKPEMMVQCHCLDCQKTSGTGHTSNAYFAREDVNVEGEVVGHATTADSGTEMSRYFCPVCGSRVFGYNGEYPDLISIAVGFLEDHSWFRPQVVLYSSQRKNWDITADEIPNFEQMPPDN